jgi:methionyl-tRNA formyltransferase
MGSPDFAVPSLLALCESGRYRPSLVVSQPDRPRGRGRTLSPTAVRARALDLRIASLTMERATYAEGGQTIATHAPEVIVVVAVGIILRRDLLDLPPRGCVNVHASLLPRHRGVSPIQAAILSGDAKTGCTTMLIDEGVDTGAMLLQHETPVEPNDTAGSLTDRLATEGAALLVTTLDGLFDGSVTPVAQDDTLATHTRKIKKEHGAIDWSQDAVAIERRIRAMTPWPSAFSQLDGRRVIVTHAVVSDHTGIATPGTILSLDPLVVACGSGAIEVRGLRPEGRRDMTPREFAAGHALAPGQRFQPVS